MEESHVFDVLCPSEIRIEACLNWLSTLCVVLAPLSYLVSSNNKKTVKLESRTIKKAAETSKKTILLVVFLVLCTVLVAPVILGGSYHHHHEQEDHTMLLKKTCTKTLYPSLCWETLSSLPTSDKAIHPRNILEIAINHAVKSTKSSRSEIVDIIFSRQDLNSHEKRALDECMEMLDQTLYELRQALHSSHSSDLGLGFARARGSYLNSYGNLKTLLSAAMTNENTCVDGLSDAEEADPESQKGLEQKVQSMLRPVSHMISNCLAIVKHLETSTSLSRKYSITKMPPEPEEEEEEEEEEGSFSFPDWMTSEERKLMEAATEIRPNVIVASDGSGDCGTIGEAVRMAPKMSLKRFVIKIKGGVYKENVEISREMPNIVFIGDGMNSTIIAGCRNFADGFSTFTSATLTVIGNKFLARDLTVINTSSPEKHQAVALRVTSDSAFYRCNFSSYQDTLYAHSFRQLYSECTIQGTIDFIFGNAAALFQNCLILVRRPIPGQKNMITAQARDDSHQNTGFFLDNCIIIAAPDLRLTPRSGRSSTFFGRPWRNHSRVMVMGSYVGSLVHPSGWYKWNQYSTGDTVEYMECRNRGPGSHTEKRVTWGGYKRNCTEEEIASWHFTLLRLRGWVGEFLNTKVDWHS